MNTWVCVAIARNFGMALDAGTVVENRVVDNAALGFQSAFVIANGCGVVIGDITAMFDADAVGIAVDAMPRDVGFGNALVAITC